MTSPNPLDGCYTTDMPAALWGIANLCAFCSCRRKAEVSHDGAHVSSMLCCGNSGKEFRFGGAGSSDGLRLTSVGDSAATQEEGIASSRSAVAQIVGVCGIEKCNRFLSVDVGELR